MKTMKQTLGIVVLIMTIVLTNRGLWLCLTDVNDPLTFCSYNYPGQELILYFFGACLAIWLLLQSQMGKVFINKWKGNILILVFVTVAILSISWSILPTTTLYYLLILLFSTLLAAFLGTFFSLEQWLVLLTGTGAIIVLASGVIAVLFPHAVIMAAPHEGSWRGIYWHKNITGSLMAFWNAVFLLYTIHIFPRSKWRAGLIGLLYLLSAVFVFISLSGAGIAVWLGLNVTIVILFLWSKFRQRITKQHYILLGGSAAIFLILALTNLDFVFGLLNRESSLTGRTPLWNYLIQTTVSQKPILGYGFSAIWDDREFRNQVTRAQGWPFTITNSHNGFFDILLGLGIVGLMLVVLLLILAFYRTGKRFFLSSSLENLLPLVSVLYFFLANLSTSFFLEMDSFHWVLLITAIFLCTPPVGHESQAGSPTIQPAHS